VAESPNDCGETRVHVRTEINGRPHAYDVGPDESALTLVRERARLTGSKLGCGQGVCGACTMMLDDTPVVHCLLPATALEGRSVRTIESFTGPDGALHPVERAFMALDALQCGYCTPGFVVEAIHFFTTFRRTATPGSTPDADAIAEALAGHLCRCGAYPAILAAVQRACAGDFDDSGPPAPRYDARAKVEGSAKYTVDLRLEGQLEGRILRAPYASATIVRLDCAPALAVPGVKAAVPLARAGGRVRYAHQEIAAVAAVDEDAAREGLRRIAVEYDLGRPVTTIEDALAPGAPLVYDGFGAQRTAPSAIEGPKLPVLSWEKNLRGPFFLMSCRPGAARRAVARAEDGADGALLVDATFTTQHQTHTPLEPHACIAGWDDAGRLTLHMSTQAVSRMAADAASRFSLAKGAVEVRADYVGGGFGSKADLTMDAIAAVELARAAKAPVRVVLDRREELQVGGVRPAVSARVQVVVDRDGLARGLVTETKVDSGVAVGSSTSSLFRLMYPRVPKSLEDWDVLTNTPPGKPFRGPGGPPTFFALEQILDEVAHRRSEDPIATRRRWDDNPPRRALYDWAEKLPLWSARRAGADAGRYRRGVGLAAAGWLCFADPESRVQIDASARGLVVSTAAQDMGNGTRSSLAHSVARVFGVEPQSIDVRVGSSRAVHGPTSAGSRTTASLAPAAQAAAEKMRDALVAFAAKKLGLAHAKPGDGGIAHDGGVLPWPDVWALAPERTIVAKRPRDRGGYLLPIAVGETAVSKHLSGAVQVTEVEVDTWLGKVRVLRASIGLGVGRIVVPPLARSQVRGAVVQGIGFALYEERRLDRATGVLLTANLEDYRVCGIGDAPEIDVHFDEGGFEHVPGSQVGLGELATLPCAASIANAVFDATGWRPYALPLRVDRVLAGLAGLRGTRG
jgi:xanthine dehydrogenase YagR molybdenum-binding subunit